MGIDNAWTDEEDALLRQYAGKITRREIADKLRGRTVEAVKKRLQRLELIMHARAPAQPWTTEQDAVLRQWSGKASIRFIAKQLPGRSRGAVYSRMEALGLLAGDGGWRDSEDAILMAARTLREAANALDRSFSSCRARRALLLKSSDEDYPEEKEKAATFTPADELDLLRQEYPGQSYRNYRIPSEGINARRFSAPLGFSPTGSSAAMCAGAV